MATCYSARGNPRGTGRAALSLSSGDPAPLAPSAAGRPRRGRGRLPPPLAGDDAALLLAEVAAHARRQPVASAGLAVPRARVQRVQHVEDVAAREAQAVGRAGLQLEVRADVEGVAHARLHHFLEDWGARGGAV